MKLLCFYIFFGTFCGYLVSCCIVEVIRKETGWYNRTITTYFTVILKKELIVSCVGILLKGGNDIICWKIVVTIDTFVKVGCTLMSIIIPKNNFLTKSKVHFKIRLPNQAKKKNEERLLKILYFCEPLHNILKKNSRK